MVVKTKVAAEREKASSLLPAVLGISHYSNISADLRCQRGKGQQPQPIPMHDWDRIVCRLAAVTGLDLVEYHFS